ncbi:MAG: type IV pilus assembly protein PilM [Candidatus Omnitrophota bacterium]
MGDKNLIAKIFSGVKRMPAEHTLRLVSSKGQVSEKYFASGVDFGFSAIKLAQIGIINRKPQIINLIIEELPGDLKDHPQERKKVVTEIFKKIVQENRIKGEVVSSMPSSLVQIKKIRLPSMPSDEVTAAVKWEMKQSSPISLDDLAFDYYILEQQKSALSNGIEVMTISCSKKDVLEQIAVIEVANLVPQAIEVDYLAAVRLAVRSMQIKKEEAVLFLEFGCHSCSLSIIINSQVCFKRDLAISGDTLTQAIVEHNKVSYSEAERLKKSLGLIGADAASQLDLDDATKESAIVTNEALWLHLENLIQEIDYTFKYFSHQLIDNMITKFDRIILSGGSTNLARFSAYLNTCLGVPVELIDPLREIYLGPEFKSKFADLSSLAPRLSVAVGLAIRGLDK